MVLEELYVKYRQLMFYVANEILDGAQLAEDAVQEAFIGIAKNMHKINCSNSGSTKAFLVTVVRNVALTMLKKENHYYDFSEYQDLIVDKQEVEKDVLDRMEVKSYISAICKLPEKYRDILYLHCVEEYTIAEISKILQLSQEVVKKRIQRGRKKILKDIKRGHDLWMINY